MALIVGQRIDSRLSSASRARAQMLGTDYNGNFQALFSSTSQVQVPIEIIHGHEPLPDERTGYNFYFNATEL